MAAIDWLPKRNGCVAVSAVKNVNFDERVQLSGQVKKITKNGESGQKSVFSNIRLYLGERFEVLNDDGSTAVKRKKNCGSCECFIRSASSVAKPLGS